MFIKNDKGYCKSSLRTLAQISFVGALLEPMAKAACASSRCSGSECTRASAGLPLVHTVMSQNTLRRTRVLLLVLLFLQKAY